MPSGMQRFIEMVQQTRSRQQGNLVFCGKFASGMFQSKNPDLFGGGPDEADLMRCALFREIGILAQKAISGMDGLGAGLSCNVQYFIGTQIAVRYCTITNTKSFIGFGDMARQGIRIGINRHTFNTDTAQRAYDAAGDCTAIGNQYFIEHSAGILCNINSKPANGLVSGCRRYTDCSVAGSWKSV